MFTDNNISDEKLNRLQAEAGSDSSVVLSEADAIALYGTSDMRQVDALSEADIEVAKENGQYAG